MVEHLQSGHQTMVPEDSGWQAMPQFSQTGCTVTLKPQPPQQKLEAVKMVFVISLLAVGWSLPIYSGEALSKQIMNSKQYFYNSLMVSCINDCKSRNVCPIITNIGAKYISLM